VKWPWIRSGETCGVSGATGNDTLLPSVECHIGLRDLTRSLYEEWFVELNLILESNPQNHQKSSNLDRNV
jgi:hypothetical protein